MTVNLNNSGSSAAQAVLSLTQQWQAFVTRLSAQITSLTDLIMRIQKKVKA